MKAKLPSEAEYCADTLIHNIGVDFKPKLLSILEDY